MEGWLPLVSSVDGEVEVMEEVVDQREEKEMERWKSKEGEEEGGSG